jgi:CyaY protein
VNQQHGEIMTDTEFMNLAEQVLKVIESSCDRINDDTQTDIDNQRTGGMITLVFANRSQIVINLQKPLHEIWLAAKCGGFHYHFDGAQWLDTKGQGEFFACLSRYASDQSGTALSFSPQ